MFDPTYSHPEYLRREPVRRWSILGKLGIFLQKLVELLVVTALSLPFWPLYLVLRLVFPRPPTVPSIKRVWRCFWMILTERQALGPTLSVRMALLLELARQVIGNGFWGFAWLLDEVIWGRRLKQVQIVEPLFEISAARSGSTQIAHYLEDDQHLCAPSALQISFPILWLWRIAPLFEPLLPVDWADKLGHKLLPPEHHERHEVDIRRTDTFEMIFYTTLQLGGIFFLLGPKALREEICIARINDASRDMWENDFLRFIDTLGRKTLLHAKPDPSGKPRRYFIKGHFLHVAQHLAQKYPDARFLTMVRAPEKRFQSIINFLRCQPTLSPNPAVPWPWLVEYVCAEEVEYCEQEMAWYEAPDGPRRCVVRFDEYLKDLEGTMRRIYRECLDRDLSPHVPLEHTPRTRTNYSVDRSLAELGIDENALKERLAAYRQWCKVQK